MLLVQQMQFPYILEKINENLLNKIQKFVQKMASKYQASIMHEEEMTFLVEKKIINKSNFVYKHAV